MEFNPQIDSLLSEYNIDSDLGHLFLLAVYHGLDVTKIVPEAMIKMMALTKIVEIDFENPPKKNEKNNIIWNVPLFSGAESQTWDWVKEWNDRYGKVNSSRKGAYKDVLKRMKQFFSENPEIRKDDVYNATTAYMKQLSSPVYLKDSAAFIFEGAGLNKKSQLLKWCEITKSQQGTEQAPDNNIKGKILN